MTAATGSLNFHPGHGAANSWRDPHGNCGGEFGGKRHPRVGTGLGLELVTLTSPAADHTEQQLISRAKLQKKFRKADVADVLQVSSLSAWRCVTSPTVSSEEAVAWRQVVPQV